MAEPLIDDLPGFRRRFVVTPTDGRVVTEVEDDFHHMEVTVEHDGEIATRVEGRMIRIPWITCPGAPAVLASTFTGVALSAFGVRGEKQSNCTHLHDLAVLAAAHAHDPAPLVYDILTSDLVEGRRRTELRLDGVRVMGWTLVDDKFTDPAPIAGLRLDQLRAWIETLDAAGQEQARLLRWGSILAHGRGRTYEGASADRDPSMKQLPIGQCYTFQPQNAPKARYILGTIRDFTGGADGPLAGRLEAVHPASPSEPPSKA